MMPKILAIDSTTENCSVALTIGDEILVETALAPRDHTKLILPMVDKLLSTAQLTLTELDALAFAQGPGSFTGVRITIGIAQGLAYGAKLPLIGVSTLAALAEGTHRLTKAKHVACAIDARMNEIYWARYARSETGLWQLWNKEMVINPRLLAEQLSADDKLWHTCGTGWNAYQDALSALPLAHQNTQVLYPDAQDIAKLAKLKFFQGDTTSAEKASPVYLRDTVTWKKLPGK